MRLSGTYFERFIYFFIPIICLIGMLLLIFGLDRQVIFKSCTIFPLLFWLLDTITLFINYKNPQRLLLEDKQMRYGNNNIAFNDIRSIEIIIVRGFFWTNIWVYRMIKIELLTSGIIYAIPKPISIIDLIRGRQSKTEALIQSSPPLKDKLIIKT